MNPGVWQPADYLSTLPADGATPGVAAAVFRRVWRTTLDEPGFAVVAFTGPVSSRELRQAMLALVADMPVHFVPERLGRFDQQVTSRFHRDGAPERSLLALGYEPSTVWSRVFVADAPRAAADAGMDVREFLAAHNPMFPAGEAALGPYTTDLAVPHGGAYLVVLNNSLLPAGAGNPLGVLHKADVPNPDPAARRVINSMGFMIAGDPAGVPKSAAEVEHFLTADTLDPYAGR